MKRKCKSTILIWILCGSFWDKYEKVLFLERYEFNGKHFEKLFFVNRQKAVEAVDF